VRPKKEDPSEEEAKAAPKKVKKPATAKAKPTPKPPESPSKRSLVPQLPRKN
jgi:ATP-dependent Clp protease ATP-binding subunit ClpA